MRDKFQVYSLVENRFGIGGGWTLRSGLVCLSLLLGTAAAARAQPAAQNLRSLSAKQVESLLKERPVDRIVKRNLFHPTRGVLPVQPETEVAQAAFPMLRGTWLTGDSKGAILQWPSQPAGIFLELGGTYEAFKLRKVEADRVELVHTKNGEARWVGLEDPSGERIYTPTEFQQLLALRGAGASTTRSLTPLKGAQ